ncbi:hypothetical protein D1BOALGB6SA_10904 [Olavius sp. associated proteobacterium Delta 1]|nr:hypothetical protein D1BOALGB6SA_10904 [Olavius sp. associated proteobacterium Delta 1]
MIEYLRYPNNDRGVLQHFNNRENGEDDLQKGERGF